MSRLSFSDLPRPDDVDDGDGLKNEQEVTFPGRPMILARLSPKERSFIHLCDLVNVKTILIQ